jgi:hypothetical protein
MTRFEPAKMGELRALFEIPKVLIPTLGSFVD